MGTEIHKLGKNHIMHHLRFFLAGHGRNSSHLTRSALRARDTHFTWIDASARGFWRLFPFLTRSALRAIQKTHKNHTPTKPHAKTKADPQA